MSLWDGLKSLRKKSTVSIQHLLTSPLCYITFFFRRTPQSSVAAAATANTEKRVLLSPTASGNEQDTGVDVATSGCVNFDD